VVVCGQIDGRVCTFSNFATDFRAEARIDCEDRLVVRVDNEDVVFEKVG